MNSNVFVVQSFAVVDSFEALRLPTPGETIISYDHIRCTGGKGLNQAQAVGFFGVNTEVIGRIGDDALGRENQRICLEGSIGTRFLKMDKNLPTGKCSVFRSKDGDNMIMVYPGAANNFSIDDFMDADSYVATCGIGGFQLEVNPSTVYAAIQHADEMGVMTLLDPSPVPEHFEQQVFSHISYFKANEYETSQLSGIQVEDVDSAVLAGRKLLEKGVKKAVIVTLGSRGAVYVDNKCAAYYPAPAVTVRDSSAAGDCFAGAFIAAVALGKGIHESMLQASCFAALKVANVVKSIHNLYEENFRRQYERILHEYTKEVPEPRFIERFSKLKGKKSP